MQNVENSLESDLTSLRSLAEAGMSQPLQIGPYLVAGGAWFGSASFLLALAQLGSFSIPEAFLGWVFLIASAGFAATIFLLIHRDRQSTERGKNRFINATWSGAGLGIFAFWISSSVMADRLASPEILSTMSLSVLAIYGLVWWITGVLSEQGWMKLITAISFCSMILVAWFAPTPYGWLSYTTALVACALLPGIHITRTAKQTH
ncbi:hypothetical protein R0137_03425 [Congregibacter brevis]|uniref:Uncharacterized protein n=1 Tax=Congregibacter brevis TaxID=3081201 RepID=A0ABZ0IER1_9GAMM|nr:hypothetical protein R0137_03425 [Congregibacter sp. IMCC45268]